MRPHSWHSVADTSSRETAIVRTSPAIGATARGRSVPRGRSSVAVLIAVLHIGACSPSESLETRPPTALPTAYISTAAGSVQRVTARMTIEVSQPSRAGAQFSARTMDIEQSRDAAGRWSTELVPVPGSRPMGLVGPTAEESVERVIVGADGAAATVRLHDGRVLRSAVPAPGAAPIVRNPATNAEIGIRSLGASGALGGPPNPQPVERSILLTTADVADRLAALRAGGKFVVQDSSGLLVVRRTVGDTLLAMTIDSLRPEPTVVRMSVRGTEIMSLTITHREVLPGAFVRERMSMSRRTDPRAAPTVTVITLANVQTSHR